jgi:2-polyprenyl-3-methyl-5-hydroxy-6-metoxy-1,4-benzoquinol methylase
MNWDYSKHYASFHPDTPHHRREMHGQKARWLARHLPSDRATPILDIGCGYGYALGALQELGYSSLIGIDSDAGQVSHANKQGFAVEKVSAVPQWLEGHSQRFGVILLLDVLEHIPQAQQPEFLQSIAGSLMANGKLIISTPNAAASLAGYWRYIDYTHLISFTVPSLTYLLGHTGFPTVTFHEIELAAPSWSLRAFLQRCFRRWRRLEYMAEFGRGGREIPLTPNLLAVAQKS